MSTTPTAEAINTWEQIGPDGWAIISKRTQGARSNREIGWELVRHWRESDPRSMSSAVVAASVLWWNYDGDWRERRKVALADLMQQAEAITGIPADGWVRNRMGDYVPREIAKARPLRKEAR